MLQSESAQASGAARPKAVVLLSGGLDSATAAAQAIADGYEVLALSLRYGQRHERELQAAQTIARTLDIRPHFIVDVNLGQWGGSALTDLNKPIPSNGVQPGIVPATYVPGRNTVFIALALSLAEVQDAVAIYLGINAVDYSGYPDCRPEYLAAYQTLATLSSKVGLDGQAPRLIAPLLDDSKLDIVRRALALGVPIAETWSCYQGDREPCGLCDSCRIRDKALIEAGCPELATPMGRQLHESEQVQRL
ncbi:MAG: 7-cyano-7-deazaguanine synthase QueC [Synechococcales cyanobacterium CRU_2_2]|nr:7-cyano-7-deazaguanine synthase QueC [Synechococcales cyanobacterium CRU_2_2]